MDAFIITFREGLEAAIAVGVIAAYLAASGRLHLERWVGGGVLAAVAASASVGILLQSATEIIEGALFEGIVYLTAAVFMISMVIWMLRTGSRASAAIKDRADAVSSWGHPALQAAGVFLVTFLLVAREGIETALFLVAAGLEGGTTPLFWGGASGGLIAALGVGAIVFVGGKRLDLKVFFATTSVVLIALAVRFTASGIEELAEASVFAISHSFEEGLELVAGTLGHPVTLALMALVPVAGLVWSAINRPGTAVSRLQ